MMSTYPNRTHYSEHFSVRELSCHCGCDAPSAIDANLARLAIALEALRLKVGTPLHVNSGYRCKAYNTKIKGKPASQHMEGLAADLSGRDALPAGIAAAADTVFAIHKGGIGVYPTFCHVDIRSNGPARW